MVVGLYAGWVRAKLPGRRVVAMTFVAIGLTAFPLFMAAALGPMLTFRIQ